MALRGITPRDNRAPPVSSVRKNAAHITASAPPSTVTWDLIVRPTLPDLPPAGMLYDVMSGSEPLERPLASPKRFDLAISRRSVDTQRADQLAGRRSHLIHREVKGRFVRTRRLRRSAQLSHELKSRRADLVVGRGWLKIG